MGYMLVHDLSIKAYSLLHISIKVNSLLQEVCINCTKSKCMLVFSKKCIGDIVVHELSSKAYSPLQEVFINCFKSRYILVFYKIDG